MGDFFVSKLLEKIVMSERMESVQEIVQRQLNAVESILNEFDPNNASQRYAIPLFILSRHQLHHQSDSDSILDVDTSLSNEQSDINTGKDKFNDMDDEDDIGGVHITAADIRTKNEIIQPQVMSRHDIQSKIPENVTYEKLGSIVSIVENSVVIEADSGKPVLDLGSILVLSVDKLILGEVFTVIQTI